MKAAKTPPVSARLSTRAPVELPDSLIHINLTPDERDAIDGAKGRLRRLAALVVRVLNTDVEYASDYDERRRADRRRRPHAR
jgi:hypothetical protein